jgi:hypothetical protein
VVAVRRQAATVGRCRVIGGWTRERELYRRDNAGVFFAGFVYGMLAALAYVLLMGGCWTASQTADPSAPTYVIREGNPAEQSCERLSSIVGKVPTDPDVSECIARSDPEGYWMCTSGKWQQFAGRLSRWIDSAIAVCAP